MKKISLSPTLFIILEFFILLPSFLFFLGILEYIFNKTGFVIYYVTNLNLIRSFFVTIVLPFAGGFLAYNYLERYKLKALIRKTAKAILAYSIIETGLVLIMALLIRFHI